MAHVMFAPVAAVVNSLGKGYFLNGRNDWGCAISCNGRRMKSRYFLMFGRLARVWPFNACLAVWRDNLQKAYGFDRPVSRWNKNRPAPATPRSAGGCILLLANALSSCHC